MAVFSNGGNGDPSWLSNNSDALLGLGLGLLSGKNSQEQLSGGLGGFAVARRDQKQRNKTLEMLQGKSPELAQAIEAGILSPLDGYKLYAAEQSERRKAQLPNRRFQTLPDGTYGWSDETAGTWTPLGTAEKPVDQPAIAREYDWLKSQGYEGSPTDYLQMKKGGGANGGKGGKAPSGYRWTDETESSLEPIPGGPGEEIPGELAARLGMSKSFLEKAPDLRRKLANGDVTGWWDQRFALNGIGDRGQIYQELQSGTDALMRLLTGAGMNESEARAYSERYLPTGRDTADEAVSKLDRLTRELQATAEEAGKGRGGFNVQSGAGGSEIDALVNKYGG